MQLPKRRSDQFKKIDDGPVYLTLAGKEKLERSLARLEKDLPQGIKEVERTKKFGDFSENEEYKDAKRRLRSMHARIFSIKDRLKRAVIIKEEKNSSGVVEIGSTIKLKVNDTEKTFQILGSYESNPVTGRISERSPLGSALLGHRVGELVRVEVKGREAIYQILKIL